MSKFLKGFLAMMGAVLAWSSLEVTSSYIFAEGAGTVTLLSARFFFATILFGGTMLFKKYRTGEITNMSFVLNCFEQKAKFGYGYGYGYGYGGYGQGYHDQDVKVSWYKRLFKKNKS